jgi:pentatricopeptide repeat protein
MGAFEGVKEIARRARRDNISLTEASYTTLIQSYGELNDPIAALECLQTMRQEGLSPNSITYSAVMAAVKNPDIVLQLLHQMDMENVTKNTVVLTSAINSIARAGPAYVGESTCWTV